MEIISWTDFGRIVLEKDRFYRYRVAQRNLWTNNRGIINRLLLS